MTTAGKKHLAIMLVSVLCVLDASAYKQHINVSREAVEATGSNSVVVQVEVPSRGKAERFTARHYAPDAKNVNFRDVDIRLTSEAEVSNHSNTVAQLFFGSKRSIARGIDTAHVFSTTEWLRALGRWDLDPANAGALFPGPVVNHSWVTNSSQAVELLRRADYSALSNNVLHVAGVQRSGLGASLMAGGFNSLVVGGAVKNIATPYPVLNEFYGGGRTRPHLVGPYPHASAAAPIAAAAAVRLNALALKKNIRFDLKSRGSDEQLPVELVKAILMSSASGDFSYSAKNENYVNAFGTLGVTENGLDKRFGMGMLNVGNAEAVLLSPYFTKATEVHESVERGFGFAESAADEKMRVHISPKRSGTITATLAWLADLQRDGRQLKGRIDDFDLSLVALGDGGASQAAPVVIASSASNYDTTENLRVKVERGRTYELVVTRKNKGPSWPIALAWNLSH